MAYMKPSAGRLDSRHNTTNYEHPQETNLLDLHRAMGYDPYGAPVVRIDDTTKQHTSKNRVKISDYTVQFFNTFVGGDDREIWDEQITGTASSTYEPYNGWLKLEVGSTAGDRIVRQTRRVIPYVPGRPNEVSMAMLFGPPDSGIRRRHGAFDDFNGAYFEDGGDGTYYCVTRRNTAGGVVEERIARENWSEDKLDGTGPSGIVADPSAIQMMILEYEWYGAGQVEIKFIINNNAYPVHKFDHANVADHAWCSMPFLPVRVELENVTGAAGTHSYYVGSTAVLAEGTVSSRGIEFNASLPITGKSTGVTANTFLPMLSIRMKSDQLFAVIVPKDFQAATLDNTGIFYRIVQNAVLTNPVWVSAGPNSSVEYDISATAQSNGKILKEGYISPGNMGDLYFFDSEVLNQLARRTTTVLGDTSDILTIEVASVNANKTAYASINWIEQR